MAVFKCEMCGGNIIVQPGAVYGICDSCGNECNLEITQEERNQLLQKEETIKKQINDLQNKQKEIRSELDEINEFHERKKKIMIAIILSVVFWLALFFSGVSENITTVIGMVGLVSMFIAIPILKKYAGLYANKKGGMALGFLFQYITIGIFGLVVGVKKIIELNAMQKKQATLKNELSEQLRELKNEENRLKNN